MKEAPSIIPRRKIRLLHTSDIHVGDESDTARGLLGLQRIVDICMMKAPDVLLIAGDLFDSSRVSIQDVSDCLSELARIRTPICIVNGNHDALESPSIYERVQLEAAGAHIRFIQDPAGSRIRFDELSLSIWAKAMVAHTPANQPLAGYQSSVDTAWNVAMAHGHYVRDRQDESRSSLIRETQIEALKCDYLALGHWHRWADVSAGQTTAHYAGSPSDPFNPNPTANLITLEPGVSPSIQRIDLIS